MDTFRRRLIVQRSLAWLLWLAFLVPAAQLAAAQHAYAHTGLAASTQHDGDQADNAGTCTQCLAAAALTGAALLGNPATAASDAADHEQPPTGAISLWRAPPALGYRSRAPPAISLH
jgi:hypothetical protein